MTEKEKIKKDIEELGRYVEGEPFDVWEADYDLIADFVIEDRKKIMDCVKKKMMDEAHSLCIDHDNYSYVTMAELLVNAINKTE